MVEHWILKGLSSEIGVIIGLAWFMTSSLEISSSFLDPGAEDVVKLVAAVVVGVEDSVPVKQLKK